jgi:hypothetical protein
MTANLKPWYAIATPHAFHRLGQEAGEQSAGERHVAFSVGVAR